MADGFIKLIKMLLAPIIFGTIVVGIAKMGIGNGIATIAIAKWEGAFDRSKAEEHSGIGAWRRLRVLCPKRRRRRRDAEALTLQRKSHHS